MTETSSAPGTGGGASGAAEADPDDPGYAREIWQLIEHIHAVAYFAEEAYAALAPAGLRGFWRGYFAMRAAPLGPVGAPVVVAIFANFAPDFVSRSVPAVWDVVSPDDAIERRAAAAAGALRALAAQSGLDIDIDAVAQDTLGPLAEVIAGADPLGRPLFAANQGLLERFDDPVAALWQATTALREHRGDGHVALLASAGLDGCETHVLRLLDAGLGFEALRDVRGWSESDWDEATTRLALRGLADGHGGITDDGRALHAAVERATDVLAATAYAPVLDAGGRAALVARLRPLAEVVAASNTIRYPNPIGLTRP